LDRQMVGPQPFPHRDSPALSDAMNLPPDKMKLLSQYDNEKKWELICDQERFQVKNPPSAYIQKLKSFVDTGGVSRKFKRRVQESTQVLRELEISLRTNYIGPGSCRPVASHEASLLTQVCLHMCGSRYNMESTDNGSPGSDKGKSPNRSMEDLSKSNFSSPTHGTSKARLAPVHSRKALRNSRIVSQKDDVHVCIMCLRAIMNYQSGFSLVMNHPACVNEITLSLNNKNPRTKALVLELLAAVCLVRGGHDIILAAFDNFKEVCGEKNRFEKLMEYFRNEDSNIDFMVACMQFINIVVHSVENMNFRVFLQYEFTHLGLDEYLERLRHTESDKLKVQIQAYLDNIFDVGALLEDTETKNAVLEHMEDLQEQVGQVRVWGHEAGSEEPLAGTDLRMGRSRKRLPRTQYLPSPSTVCPLPPPVAAMMIPPPPPPLPHTEDTGSPNLPSQQQAPPSAPPPPPPLPGDDVIPPAPPLPEIGIPPPPPLSGLDGPAPPPPPPPPLGMPAGGISGPGAPPAGSLGAHVPLACFLHSPSFSPPAVKIKKPIQTKFRMPIFNWVALKPNQINGTVFNDLNDERVLQELDMNDFEEQFKTKAQGPSLNISTLKVKAVQKAPSKVTLIESNRAKNLAITLRKGGLSIDSICQAIQTYDLQGMSLDFLELLHRFVPTEYELTLIRKYEKDQRPLEELSDEDIFMIKFSKIPRLAERMNIMTFLGNFSDTAQLLMPQLNAIIAASISIKSSTKLRNILEIVLAFGNYMNSSKRGAAYGFRLQSLDALLEMKSTDRKQTLLHYIVRVINEKYPELTGFHTELHFLDKAGTVSLDSVLQDMRALQQGMELTRKEFMRQDDSQVLKDFLKANTEVMEKLQTDGKTAQEAYESAVEYFGENPKTNPPTMFFPVFGRFVKAYKKAEQDVELWRKEEAAAKEVESNPPSKQEPKSPVHKVKRQQMDMIAELKKKQMVKEPLIYEGGDGAIEDIISGKTTKVYPVWELNP
uniref:Formin like 1 n=1 Tax=Pelusios castaneus TaxID=367368 RepID=A0A8C8SN62_9SAUR